MYACQMVDFSEEQGECFYQDLRGMEERYQGL